MGDERLNDDRIWLAGVRRTELYVGQEVLAGTADVQDEYFAGLNRDSAPVLERANT